MKVLGNQREQFDTRYLAKDAELEKTFLLKSLDKININLWDDFNPEEGTYVYVEEEAPLALKRQILEFIIEIIRNSHTIRTNKEIQVDLQLYNAADKYPAMLGTEAESALFIAWEISLKGITWSTATDLTQEIAALNLSYCGIPIAFYSES